MGVLDTVSTLDIIFCCNYFEVLLFPACRWLGNSHSNNDRVLCRFIVCLYTVDNIQLYFFLDRQA